MSIISELTRFANFLKRLFNKLPDQAVNIKSDLDKVTRALAIARPFVPDSYKDEVDKALEIATKLRTAADAVDGL
jgi:hypothetical protein